MKRTRRNHGATLKAQVAFAAAKGDKTLAELVEPFRVHPTQITGWKQQLVRRAADVCGGTKPPSEVSTLKALHAKLEQLILEQEFVDTHALPDGDLSLHQVWLGGSNHRDTLIQCHRMPSQRASTRSPLNQEPPSLQAPRGRINQARHTTIHTGHHPSQSGVWQCPVVMDVPLEHIQVCRLITVQREPAFNDRKRRAHRSARYIHALGEQQQFRLLTADYQTHRHSHVQPLIDTAELVNRGATGRNIENDASTLWKPHLACL